MKRFNRRKARRRRPPLASKPSKVCAYCGVEFVAKKRDRIYCYDGYCAVKAYQNRISPLNGERTFTCDGCGSEFTAKKANARWCSKRCANRHWGNVRARQRPLPSEADYTDLEIFERDNWTCHICHKPVDRKADRLSPNGATIDHLVPISQGGRDVAANVATAHWKCNHSKGVRGTDQLRLM